MGLSVYFDIAAIFLCIVLLFSLAIRKLTRGRINILFLALIVIIAISGLCDTISNLYGPVFPQNKYTISFQSFLNYVYFTVRNFTTPFYIVYITAVIGIWHKFKESKVRTALMVIPYCIDLLMLLSNPWTKFVFEYGSDGIYHRGKLIIVLYVVAFYYMVFGMIVVLKNIKALGTGKCLIFLLFYPLNALSVVAQFINYQWRIEMIVTAIVTLFVAIGVQRPEENLEEAVNTQSYNAFLKDVHKGFITGRPICITFIKIKNHLDIRKNFGIENYYRVLRIISDMINRICRIMGLFADIYYLDRGTFAIIMDMHKKEYFIDASRLICSYVKEPVKLDGSEVNMDSIVAMVDVPKDIAREDKLINFAQSFSHYLQNEPGIVYLEKHLSSRDYRLKSGVDEIIQKAILNTNFKMFYQPIYSVAEQKFVSAEALIRLVDREFGFVPPSLFIPAAENSGAIHKIGEFVFDSVFRFVSEHDLKKLSVEYIEVNLSVAQCIDINLVSQIENLIKKYGISPANINLEITETAVEYDKYLTGKNIEELRSLGFSFSLDDYGTGYSNILRLINMPMDIVKIDKSLADEINNPRVRMILMETIEMLKKINKKILVEGVEDKDTLDRFIEMGCDYIQGYYFSKPIPEEDYIEFLEKNNCPK